MELLFNKNTIQNTKCESNKSKILIVSVHVSITTSANATGDVYLKRCGDCHNG